MRKSVRIILAVFACIFALAVPTLPFVWKLNWLPGWMTILARLIPLVIAFPILLKAVQPNKKVFTLANVGWCALACVLSLAMSAQALFLSRDRVSEYIHSPNNKHTAVVITSNYGSSTVYAMRARVFYEDGALDNQVPIGYGDAEVTYRWVDDNTLEVVTAYEDGSGATELIRW